MDISRATRHEHTDEMTPLERVRAHGAGEPFDRLPVLLFIDNHAARVAGITLGEFAEGGKAMADAQLAAYRLYRPDGISTLFNTGIIAEAMGAPMAVPRDSMAYIAGTALQESDDPHRLTPADPARDGRLPGLLEALQRLLEEVGDEVDVSATVPGPVTTAAGLVGTERLCRLFGRDPDTAHTILAAATRSCIAYARAAVTAGAGVSIAEPVATPDIMGPHHFEAFVSPYLRHLVQAIAARAGKPPRMHVCGRTELMWEHLAATGVSGLSLDEVDMGRARAALGERLVLLGNVRPVRTLLLGGPEDVRAEVADIIARAGDSPKGLIVAPGCELAVDTPPENALAMVDAVREFGRHPVRAS